MVGAWAKTTAPTVVKARDPQVHLNFGELNLLPGEDIYFKHHLKEGPRTENITRVLPYRLHISTGAHASPSMHQQVSLTSLATGNRRP